MLFGANMNICLRGCTAPFEEVPGKSGRSKTTVLLEPVPSIHLIPPSPSDQQTFGRSSSSVESSHHQTFAYMRVDTTNSRPNSSWTQRISGFFDSSKLSLNPRTAPRPEAASVYLAPHPDLPEDPFASRIDMAALSTGVGSLRDVFKQDGPLAAGTGECGVATENDEDRVTVKEKQDPVQPRSQTPAGQSYKVADSISH
ncbi:hypothetical protein C345_02554 [Cryptococcus neoformans A2-102-5]|nr:hypothetical protein C346_02683 [Cryptococcus neoformans var. grubii D17-1]OXG96469.1 hypothetical protein C345_02554 [Cryptococcus neoformans var. grubii A2-102-5]